VLDRNNAIDERRAAKADSAISGLVSGKPPLSSRPEEKSAS